MKKLMLGNEAIARGLYEAGCDVVVLEAGMGGRLDSTNVIRNPLLSVITGIALDHVDYLGDTVEKIAAEKAGIIKPCVPVLWCGESEAAGKVIANEAEKKGAPIFTVDRKSLNIKEMKLDGTVFDFGERRDILLSLLGSYQPINASNVLSAVDLLGYAGLEISDSAVRRGLESVVWHARFEIINDSPLMIADGGHNPEGID